MAGFESKVLGVLAKETVLLFCNKNFFLQLLFYLNKGIVRVS